uniref:Glycosyltransferase 2-like domain-containing protein n=1 Tax=Romanomermis culicivorax TaxID=13658 RepID=A0A915HK57_ROMCU
MLPIFRKWRRKLFVPFMIFITFLSIWMLMTMFLLELQEQFFQNGGQQPPNDISQSDYEYLKNRVQVVVGHYNGNLPKDENKKKNLSQETINENNYNPFPGFGEKGKAVRLNGEDEIKSKDLFQINQFNLVASDRIALNRTLLDARKKACQFLQSPLEKFAMQQSVPVHIVRSKKRVGLIRARLLGAERGEGKVLTFLDSHCECTEGWLEPLLSRISEDRTVAVCPIIDVINDRTFAYNKGIELFRGGFNWNLQFRWYSVSPKEIARRGRDSTAPIR